MSGFLDAWQRELERAHAAMDRQEKCLDEHGYGCTRAECGRRPGFTVGLVRFIPKETP